MATTTNYGWTTPDDTALVKDGAAAIRTLGSSIDTSLNTALGTKKAGMVLLNTTSFSAVASQSINDVFSTTYDNYRILLNIDSAPTQALTMRMRVGGSDNSASNYMWAGFTIESNTVFLNADGSSGAVTSFGLGSTYGNTTTGDILISNPFRTQHTQVKCKLGGYSSTSNWATNQDRSGTTTVTTSYTGFTILIASSTITGSLSVYGINK